ncbi:MAG: hypothetical protein K0V04_26170 [Deltaproteobacteria bacterium]|nr:hypothetical protein [Deltaproteobacteria bacterium]
MRVVLSLLLGLSLGLTAGCDDEPSPSPTCVDWLQCYVDCRDQQYARGDDQALPVEDLHAICISQCQEVRMEVDSFPSGLDSVLQSPEDVAFFWERTSFCLNGGDASNG